MKNTIALLTIIVTIGCSNSTSEADIEYNKSVQQKEHKINELNDKVFNLKDEIIRLKAEYNSLPQNELIQLNSSIESKKSELANIQNNIATNKAELEENPKHRYVIKFELKQSRFSLDIGQHMKDSMNAAEFELPVDKEFYDSVHVGQELVDKFRTGSLLINGSF
jgi:chromosome segregation ATPase